MVIMLDTKIFFPAILAVVLFMVPQIEASQISDAVSPEIRVALDTKANGQPVTAKNWMVAAANPLAVEAGSKVLKRGGTAADAMVAVQAVLGLVEPQSSGLGGLSLIQI